MSWGDGTLSDRTNGYDGSRGDSDPPIGLLVAGQPGRAQALYAAFAGDARFQVLAMATSPEDLSAKLALEPEALVVDLLLFSGPEEAVRVLSLCTGATLLLAPAGADAAALDALRRLTCLPKVVQGDPNLAALTGQVYEAASARRQRSISSGRPRGGLPPDTLSRAGGATSGWRSIAVWGLQGGAGRTTLATALALEAANRGLPALLVGLGAPDPASLCLGLQPEPNLPAWRTNPTPEGLRACVQHYDRLDVLAGFPGPLDLRGYEPDSLDGGGSLPDLASAAAYAGYAVVVLDVSASELAPAALAAANSLVLVALPTLPGLLAAVEAARLLHETMAGRHRIAARAVHLVLNRARRASLAPDEFVKSGGRLCAHFPALAAVVPDDPQVEEALNGRRPAYAASESLRLAARTLGDLLYAAPAVSAAQRSADLGRPGRVYTLGPVRIRV